MMKDSTIDPNWLREQMAKNPPSVLGNGNIFTGPVRLSFPNLFKPGKPSDDALRADPSAQGKFGAAVLFPLGTAMAVFEKAWTDAARAGFPKNWDDAGRPIGLHSPFHDQAEKAFGAKPLAGYTPGAITFTATSQYKPVIVDSGMNPIVDESRVYPGVWAFLAMNTYVYKNRKSGVAFGLNHVMLIADDSKLGGGGGGDPKQAFGHVAITAASNVASKFDNAPAPQHASPAASIMPAGGHVGAAGHLPVHAIESEEDRLMREMMG